MPTIGACLVVKNEGRTLAKCCESFRTVVDETVIGVDDSCTDDTYEIASKYASPGKLFTFQWQGDFSLARNLAIQRCETDFVFIVDGHEYVPDDAHPVSEVLARMRRVDLTKDKVLTPLSFLEVLRRQGTQPEFEVICINLAMNVDEAGIPALFFLQPRLFRNNGVIHYEKAVHNHLMGYNTAGALGCPEGCIVHAMPAEREEQRKKQRAKMNFSGLLADLKKQRHLPIKEQDGRPYFYMGNSHADMGHPLKAIYWYERYLKRSKFGEEKYQACQQLAVLYHRHRGDSHKARNFAMQALELQWKRSEPFIVLAEIAVDQKDFEQAIHWYNLADQYPAPQTVMFMQGAVYSFMADIKRALCHQELGQWHEALRFAERALSWRPGDPEVHRVIEQCQTKLREGVSAADANFLIVDRIGSFSGDVAQHFAGKMNVIRRNDCDERWKAWANLVWFEWCDQNLIQWSRQKWHCPVICRLHSYEAFSDMPEQVFWPNVDHLIFVAEHIRDMFCRRWPQIAQAMQGKVSVIPNGVKFDGLTYRERGHGNRVGFLGYLNPKKGTETLLELVRHYPEYEWHVAGQFQDQHLAQFFEAAAADLPNLWWHGWIEPDKKDDWLDGMNYLVSPSIAESFGYTIAEAAAKGIKPLVRRRPGVESLWPSAWVWRDVEDFRRVLTSDYDSASYRRWIEDHYSLARQMEPTETLIKRLLFREMRQLLPYKGVPITQINTFGLSAGILL